MRGINSLAATWNNRVCKVDYNEAKLVASQVCGGRERRYLEQFGIGICGVNDLNGCGLGSILSVAADVPGRLLQYLRLGDG